MAKLQQTTEVTTTTTVALKPQVKRKLLTELKAYAELATQAKALKHAMKAHEATIEGIRDKVGEKTLKLEGFSVTRVTGDTSRLDKMKLLEAGVLMSQIEAATVTKAKKAFTKVTCPGERDYGTDED